MKSCLGRNVSACARKILTCCGVRLPYVGNIELENALVVQFVTSTEPHALITSIDVSDARTMPGVVDVVTADDIELDLMPVTLPVYPETARRPVLASERVLFVGQAIAAVVAETEAQAADAIEQIIVEYDPLTPVVSLEDAASDTTILLPDVGTNIMLAQTGEPTARPTSATVKWSSKPNS